MRLVWGEVTSIRSYPEEQRRSYELSVKVGRDEDYKAFCYERLSGEVKVGMRVLINTTALELGLGTGGYAFVVAISEGDTPKYESISQGHIMKMRYSPLQVDVLSVEEEASPKHQIMKEATSLEGMPVVCCGLHSQVALVAAAAKSLRPDIRIAYVMTDQAALAAEFSNVLADLKREKLIDLSISVGQAFGADHEAVSLHSGLLAASQAFDCDMAIVAIGPGVVGTSTPFGHGGVAQGEALNAVNALDGKPIAVLRMSLSDERPRHRGISHHSISALSKIALAPVIVPLPSLAGKERVEAQSSLEELQEASINTLFPKEHLYLSFDGPLDEVQLRGINVRSMGRGIKDDPLFFEAAWAAGLCAAKYIE